MKLFTIAAALLLCFGLTAMPAVAQSYPSNQNAHPDVTKGPVLEYASVDKAVIAWTSKQGADMDLHYGTDAKNLSQKVDAVEKLSGDNHRATISGLQPNTTYFLQMTTNGGQPVGKVFSFKTPAQGQPPIHEQNLNQ